MRERIIPGRTVGKRPQSPRTGSSAGTWCETWLRSGGQPTAVNPASRGRRLTGPVTESNLSLHAPAQRAAVRRGSRRWKLRRMAAIELEVLCRAVPGHWPGAGLISSGSAKKLRASGQHSLSVPPDGTVSQRCSRSRTPRMAVAIVLSSTRASRSCSDGSFCRAARSRTPVAVSGPSPHRLATQLASVLARRCPAVSQSASASRPAASRVTSELALAWVSAPARGLPRVAGDAADHRARLRQLAAGQRPGDRGATARLAAATAADDAVSLLRRRRCRAAGGSAAARRVRWPLSAATYAGRFQDR
jgi:hypothetical protein